MTDAAKVSSGMRGAVPGISVMRTNLGRARGLGASRSGTGHWWAERLTSVALVPLMLWFLFAALHLAGLPRATVAHWATNTLNTSLLFAFVIVIFYHMQLGLQVVIDDYIHSGRTRLAALLVMRGVVGLVGLMAAVSILKLAFIG